MPSPNGMDERLRQQEIKTAKLEVLSENMHDVVIKLSDAALKQDVILEKLTSLDAKFEQSLEEVRKDHLTLIAEYELKLGQLDSELSKLKPVLFFLEYPKILVLTLVMLYVMTIQEVRDVVLKLFGISI